MFGRGSRGVTYGVFVRFRRSKLRLRCGIERIEDALSIAEALRRERPDGGGDVFVARESDGVVVSPAPEIAASTEARAASEARDDRRLRAAMSARAAEAHATSAARRLAAIVGTIAAEIDLAPPAMRESHARAVALRAMTAKTIASFSRVRSQMEAAFGDAEAQSADRGATPASPV